MKSNTHPTWNHTATVTCSCGNTFVTGSTHDTLEVDICSACHPFFTGEMKFVDRQGRVDKFKKKMEAAKKRKGEVTAKRSKKAGQAQDQDEPQSYRQILQQQKQQVKKAAKAEAKETTNQE